MKPSVKARIVVLVALLSLHHSSHAQQAATTPAPDSKALKEWCLSADVSKASLCEGYAQAALDAINYDIQFQGRKISSGELNCWQMMYLDPDRRTVLDAVKRAFVLFVHGNEIGPAGMYSAANKIPFVAIKRGVELLCTEGGNSMANLRDSAQEYRRWIEDAQAKAKK